MRCPKCGGNTRIERTAMASVHYAKEFCNDCTWWRWMPKPKTEEERPRSSLNLAKKYGMEYCAWCGDHHPGSVGLHGHHIKAVSLGGSDERENIVAYCWPCHMRCHSDRNWRKRKTEMRIEHV